MRSIVFGAHGQLGYDMVAALRSIYPDVRAFSRPEADITDRHTVETLVRTIRPDAVINCAAYTNVDRCEEQSQTAYLVNRDGPALLADVCDAAGCLLVHISTDYVFDGKAGVPYTEEDTPEPHTVYGKSKREGEQAIQHRCVDHAIFRVCWLYGPHGTKNFVKAIVKQIVEKGEKRLSVVNDQKGTPTCSIDVSEQIVECIRHGARGIFHCSAQGECTWYEFARHIVDRCGLEAEIVPYSSAEFVQKAPRPGYSVLENRRLAQAGIDRMPHWKDGFGRYMSVSGGVQSILRNH